ncbi:MAG: hypothetical protein OEV64_14575 [Desulfobulbaceae bacterium]|nr:hypothetical protein [Desulfobulbaceae bacterium]
MKKIFSLLITVCFIGLPTSSQCADINSLLRQVAVELTAPPININIQFKDNDIPGKSEQWYCKYSVTNHNAKPKSFSAELIIYNEIGLISSVASTLSIPSIGPNETVEQLNVVRFPSADIANASQIKIVGVGLQDID